MSFPLAISFVVNIGGWAYNKPPPLFKSISKLLSHYPDIPALGSPYPSKTPKRPDDARDDTSRLFAPLSTNQFKRLASIFGDLVFESGRRAQLDVSTELGVPVWNYLFAQPVDADEHMGVFHSSEIRFGEVYFFSRRVRKLSLVLPMLLEHWQGFFLMRSASLRSILSYVVIQPSVCMQMRMV